MSDARALDYSIQRAIGRAPSRELRSAWQATNEMERRVIATSIREYLEAERWNFRREAIAVTDDTRDQLDSAIDEAIATCGGDPRAALKALLVANEFMESEIERLRDAMSTGFSRGRLSKP